MTDKQGVAKPDTTKIAEPDEKKGYTPRQPAPPPAPPKK
jgi:hypothetical protein